MNEKNRYLLGIFIGINVIYVLFLGVNFVLNRNTSEAPVISFDTNEITVSVKDGEDELLKGVYANDKEDGDLSDHVFIYGMSSFDEKQNRSITYAVFDSDNRMVTATRTLKYSDYVSPRFSSTKPLINMSLNGLVNSNEAQTISASSVVDGDISNKVSVVKVEDDHNMIYKYSVTDSTGTTSTLEVSEKLSLNNLFNSNIDIELKNYILYVKQGKELNMRSYLKNINTTLGKQNSLKEYVHIETNYNSQKPGVYETRYTLSRSNGDYGMSKLIIIVE